MNDNIIPIDFGGIEESASTTVPPRTDEQMRAIARLKSEAKNHGFGEDDFDDLRFETWLVSKGQSPFNYFANLAKIGINPAAEYAAIVQPLFSSSAYFMVFSMKPKFEHGQHWRYALDIDYIGFMDADEDNLIVFDAVDYLKDGMKLLITPGMDEYEVSLGCGLPVEFLRPDIQDAIRGLLCLLALRAAEISDAESSHETASS